jgi:tRNA(Ile)-lysidine synthase
MKWLFFLQSINQILVERSLASRNQAILLASSGGQDSTCLFQAISTLCPYWEWSLAVVSCDHGWFGSKSKSCCSQVGQLVWHNKKKYYQSIVPNQAFGEAKARSWRYESFARIGRAHSYSLVFTGHTASDRAETLFYTIIRGSSQEGLQSLSWKRKLIFGVYLARPMLAITRSTSALVCKNENFCVTLDLSNQRYEWHRSRIRKRVLPYLRRYFNPKTDQVLCQLAELAHGEACYLAGLCKSLEFRLKFQVQNFGCLPLTLQRRLLFCFFKYEQARQTFLSIELVRFSFLQTFYF